MKTTNPSFDYDKLGQGYATRRQTDPRIAACINEVLADAKTILNVGAGTGSYEPADKYVVAVEPSAVMREQRKQNNKAPAVIARADALPFDDKAFEASMAMLTIHHWPDIAKGLAEMRRVTRRQLLILTFDPDMFHVFWHYAYAKEIYEAEQKRFPTIKTLTTMLGGKCRVIPIPIPLDCVDGFTEAYYGRPEAFLENEVRRAQSCWSFIEPGMEAPIVNRLEEALASGEWDKKYGHYRTMTSFTGALRLVVAEP